MASPPNLSQLTLRTKPLEASENLLINPPVVATEDVNTKQATTTGAADVFDHVVAEAVFAALIAQLLSPERSNSKVLYVIQSFCQISSIFSEICKKDFKWETVKAKQLERYKKAMGTEVTDQEEAETAKEEEDRFQAFFDAAANWVLGDFKKHFLQSNRVQFLVTHFAMENEMLSPTAVVTNAWPPLFSRVVYDGQDVERANKFYNWKQTTIADVLQQYVGEELHKDFREQFYVATNRCIEKHIAIAAKAQLLYTMRFDANAPLSNDGNIQDKDIVPWVRDGLVVQQPVEDHREYARDIHLTFQRFKIDMNQLVHSYRKQDWSLEFEQYTARDSGIDKIDFTIDLEFDIIKLVWSHVYKQYGNA